MERVYTIPLRNVKNVKRTIRAPRAIREVQNFLTKHMKAEEVKLDESINHAIWERGIQKIPSKITVKAVKDDDGDDIAIVPYNLIDEKAEIIKETLEVDVVRSSISGSNLIGSLAVANSNGIVVSPHVLDREVKQFEELGFNVASIPSQYTAVGNIVACNDTGAIISPFLSEDAKNIIENAENIGVTAGASTPDSIIKRVIQGINEI